MKVLVTGSTGMLGFNIVRELVNRGKKVVAFDISSKMPSLPENSQVQLIQGSILQKSDIQSAIKDCDVVIHSAAMVKTSPARSSDYFNINVTGTKNVVEAALEEGVKKFIYISSSSAFDYGTMEKPGDEDNPFKGGHYGLDYINSKYCAHRYILEATKIKNLPAVVIAPTFMIGPYDSAPGSGQLLLNYEKGDLKFLPPGGKNFVDVRDVATATVNAIYRGKIGECYIVGHENLDYISFMSKAAKVLKMKPYSIRLPGFIIKAAGAIGDFIAKLLGKKPLLSYPLARISCDKQYFSPEKAREELNMPQTPVEVAIKDAFCWFKENGYCDCSQLNEETQNEIKSTVYEK